MSADHQDVIQHLAVPRYAPRLQPTPIPEAAWNDEPLFCLEVNDEWVSHILGVLIALDQQDTWIGTDDEIFAARQQVNEIMAAFMERCAMDCCLPPLTRLTDDGGMEVSYDGGVTWNPATTEDPRKSAPQLPILPTTGTGAGNKCRAANDVVRQFKDAQTAFKDQLGGGLTVLQLALAFASAVAVLFLTAGTLSAVLVPALLTLAAAIVGTGATAYDDLFTSDVWDDLLCKVYCRVGGDGTFETSGYTGLLTDIDSVFTGNVALTFSSILRGWQLEGLNNAAKTPSTDNASCDECVCAGCGALWSIFGDDPTHFHGVILDFGEDFVTVHSGEASHCYTLIRTPDNTQGCVVTEFEMIEGTFVNSGGSLVGETITEGAPNHFPADIVAGGDCMAYIQLDNSGVDTPYTVKIHFTACP